MNSIPRVLRDFFSSTARRIAELRAPREGGSSPIPSESPLRIEDHEGDDDEQTIDLLRDTLTSAPAPKLR